MERRAARHFGTIILEKLTPIPRAPIPILRPSPGCCPTARRTTPILNTTNGPCQPCEWRITATVPPAGPIISITYYPGGLLNSEDGPFASDTVTYTYNNARLRSGL